MYVLSFLDKLENFLRPFNEWIAEHHRNPFLWLGIFFGGLLIFAWAYDALRKEK